MAKTDERTKFSQDVERANVDLGITHLEALAQKCEDEGIEPAGVKKLISPALKAKLKAEAQQLHYLPGSKSRLPL